MDNLNERAVRAAIQDHLDAGRTPAEAAGEVRFLDETMAEQGITLKEDAEATRRYVEAWLTETLDASPEEVQAQLQLADEYTRFLHERVPTAPDQMPMPEKAWRDWRQARA